mmetsp:Transcript_52405/g.139242  ORF Transcript_52405/g.139242 Transcript_52405/m.139242 type:complete len:140 (+) Transcript_52405:288-707(+)
MNTSPYSQIGDNLNGDFTYAKNLYHAAKRALGLKHKAARAAEPWQFQLETAAERLSAMLEYESGNFCDWFHDAPEMLMEKYPEHVTVFSNAGAPRRPREDARGPGAGACPRTPGRLAEREPPRERGAHAGRSHLRLACP